MVTRGQTAPDFIAPAVDGDRTVELALFELIDRHHAVVLLFSPCTFVPEPTAEWLAVERAGWPDHERVATVGLTADSLYAAYAYADRYEFSFPIVSDLHGGVSDRYDLLADEWESHGDVPRRAVVVVDGDWTVRAVETADDPHDRTHPGPATRAVEALCECGVDVTRPQVDYDLP